MNTWGKCLSVMLAFALGCGARAQAPSSAISAPVTVRFMTQYDFPPFQTEQREGLTFTLADYLTKNARGAFRFVPEVLPRKRLDFYLKDPSALWVVPWAVPRFFGADATSQFDWTRPYMHDSNYLLTRRASGIRYVGPESLAGLRFGGTLGHRYSLLEPLIQDGRIIREDCYNMVCNVEKLKRGRVDVVLVPAGALPYFRKVIPDMDDAIEISPRPVEILDRSFMLPKGQPALRHYLNEIVRKLGDDPAWKDALSPELPVAPSSK